jgi:hypothetical protein
MKVISILALLNLIYLPVLAQDPIYVGGPYAQSWLQSPVGQNPDL